MGLLHYLWSRTAASNATSDAQINWAEGQAPSSVNDSARAMMASLAGYRDDIAGAIVTGGTSTAYTVTSYQIFDTLAHMNGAMIAFTPHATNGATVTLNVDGLGAKPLRSAPSVELLAGTLIQGTPYVATYNNSDAVWYLQNFYGNPYNVPLAGGMDFWGTTVPNSSFAFPAGQFISRTTYSALFAIMGTTYGAGDGSTTFTLPDKTGRVSAMKEASATRLTAQGFGGTSTNMGATGGADSRSISTGNIPTLTSTGNNSITVNPGGSASNSIPYNTAGWNSTPASLAGSLVQVPTTPASIQGTTFASGTNSISVTYTNGSQSNLPTCQPTIVCNYIIRII